MIEYGPVHRNRNFPSIKPDLEWKSNTAFPFSESFFIPLPVPVYERFS
jgi:hypothetical protein